jgi:enterochelin esterase family protein
VRTGHRLARLATGLVAASAARSAAQAPAESPRLAGLAARVAAGELGALDRFRRELATGGAPLIEPVPGNPARRLVTFVWLEREPIREVVVAGAALGRDPSRNRLSRLGTTEVWYRTLALPSDLRTTYRFALDPPAGTTGTRAHARPDPLNPKAFIYPRDPDDSASADYRVSLLELPDAAPQPWTGLREALPRGRVVRHRVSSRILGNTRRVFIYTPPGYDSTAPPHPLLIVFDGAAYLGLVPTPTILDNLIAAKRIPAVVAVLVDNPDAATRSRELDCYPPFAEFMVGELLPWIRERLRVSNDPARVVLAGSSGGGQASMCVAQRHPERFGNVLAQSGSFFAAPDQPIGDEWVYRNLVVGPRLPIRFYLDVGRFEPLFSVTGVRVMRNVLEARGYPLSYLEFSGGHDYAWWRGTLADGLIALLN